VKVMINSFIFWLVLFVSTLVLSILAMVVAIFDPEGNKCHIIARLWAKSIMVASRVKTKIIGIENLKSSSPVILMSNHQGYFDIFAYLAYLPIQFRWLAKESLFKIPFLGWGMRRAGYISIDRSSLKKGYRSLNEAAEKIKSGKNVLIFPEGTRSKDGKLLPFKVGGFTLAIKAKVNIIPMAITGSYKIMPKNRFTVKPGKIIIRIGEPIDISEISIKEKETLMNKVREKIEGLLKKNEEDKF